jgi:hypothetical protein
MACDITRGKIDLECKDAVSGIKSIMLANYSAYGFTVSSTTASGEALTDLGTLSEVFKYELKNSANTFQQDILSSRDNGTTLWTQILNFTLTKITPEMEYEMKMAALGRPIIFVEANSGQVFVVGQEFGCEISGSSLVGGTMDALNGYTMVATATEKNPIYYLDAGAITALDALVSTNNL